VLRFDPNARVECTLVAAATGARTARICQGRGIVELLMMQLNQVALARLELAETIEEETVDDRNGQRRAAMLKAISMPERASTARDLWQALRNLVGLERQAFSLDREPEKPHGKGRRKRKHGLYPARIRRVCHWARNNPQLWAANFPHPFCVEVGDVD
jgi:hypothetical protein